MRSVCLLALTLPLLSTLDRPVASIALSDDMTPRRVVGLGPADLFALIGNTAANDDADLDAVAVFAESCKVDRVLPDGSDGCRRWKFQTRLGPCRITAATLAGESEGWGIAGSVFCGTSHGLAAYFMSRNPLLAHGSNRPVAPWTGMPRPTAGQSEFHG
jgi:hypothetical protein